jgi:hypothetical protein
MPENAGGPGSLVRVLATEGKTPLKDATPSPQRAKKTSDRSQVARNRIIAGVVVAIVAIVGIFLLTRGGGSDLTGPNGEPAPGQVDFKLKDVTFVPYQPQGDQNKQKDTAHSVADELRLQLDKLFQTSYVNPDTWGDPGQIQDFFTGGATDAIEGNVATLTLGENAGDTYDRVEPSDKSTLKVHVLTDAKGNAVRASATIDFVGLATLKDGTQATLTVTGTAVFVMDGDTWKIEAYELNRSGKPATSTASPTSEAS